jgi:hypothetical protein
VTYLLSAFVHSYWIGGAQLVIFIVTWGLALRSSRVSRRRAITLFAVALAGSAAAAGIAFTQPGSVAVAGASLWTGLLLLVTIVLIVARIVAFPTVTAQSIYGAVSAYLLIGLMFAAIYAAISKSHGGHFFANGQPGNSQTFQYFSFTTLTTLGYGDFTAAGSGGRAIAVIEALTGQVFLATLVARLVAAFEGPAARRAGGQPAPPPGPGGSPGSGGPPGNGGSSGSGGSPASPGAGTAGQPAHGGQDRRPAAPTARRRQGLLPAERPKWRSRG